MLAVLGLPLGYWLGGSSRRGRAIAGGLCAAVFAEYQFHQALPILMPIYLILPVATWVSWKLYDNIATILGAGLGAFLLSTLLLPVEKVAPFELGSGDPKPGDPKLPIVLHLVLDEQMGIESAPMEIQGARESANEIRDFFLDRGFRVYPRAFSSFYTTRNSLGHITNLKDTHSEGLSERASAPFEWALLQNAYFDRMAGRGYRLNVTQADYLDLCHGGQALPAQCRTYRAWSLAFAAEAPWSSLDKWKMFLFIYPLQSRAYDLIRKGYALLRSDVGAVGIPLPLWSWEQTRAPSVETLVEMTRLEGAAREARRGDLLFGHLLLPHSPFAYTRDCSLKPPGEWQDHKDRTLPATHSNTAESRRARYRAHFEQISCTLSRVDRILLALESNTNANDAVVVVHGDHGARIGLADARAKNREKLSVSDHLDAFGTLFAVRGAAIEGGAARDILSVQSLFRSAIESDFRKNPEEGFEGPEPTIHYTAFRKRVVDSGPMVGFETGDRD
jgi:hypothetical protein